jgi:uncharacterized membrane protein
MLSKLLGLDPATAARLDPTRVFFVQPWPVWLTAAALLVVAVWTAFLYRREGQRASAFYKGFLVLLRVASLATLLFLLFQPMLRLQRVDVTPSNVVVLVDRSASMGLHDRWSNARARAQLIRASGTADAPSLTRLELLRRVLRRPDVDLLDRLEQRHHLRVYEFGAAVREVDPGSFHRRGAENAAKRAVNGSSGLQEALVARLGAPDPALTPASKIGDAVDRALDDLSGQPLAGIVLFTDGGQNLGEDPVAAARRAAGAGVPIYAVGLGDPQPPRDLAVASVLVDDVVRKGDEVTVSVGLKQRGGQGALAVPVTLREDGRVLASGTARFNAGADTAEAALSFTPQQVGQFTLQVTVPVQPGELSPSNNRRLVPLRVVDKKLQILYLESSPRWEYRYLKNAIERDTSIQFACLLTEGDPRLGGEGNRRITGFPRDVAELFRYDIILLGDVPREWFTAAQLEALRRFVQERGGSLVVIAGERSMPWEYRDTPLADLLPVVLPDTREEITSDEPFRLQLTEAGKRHPMMLIADRPEQNLQVWQQLPGVYWCGVVPRAKPGATVLAVHPTRSNESGKLPLMAVQQTGEGRCFLSLVDSTWQWRYRLGDRYFYRYWGQVLRSLTPHELPGSNRYAKLTTDRAGYALGERVTLRARLLTPAFHPVRAPAVTGKIVRDDGTATDVRLLAQPGTPGLFEAEWLPPRAGSYQISLRSPGGQEGGGAPSSSAVAETRFVVEAVSLELEKPELNEALLKRIAAASGGAVVPLGEVGALPGRLRDASVRVTSRVEHELWDSPLPLTLFTLFLVGEWALRKRKGLL